MTVPAVAVTPEREIALARLLKRVGGVFESRIRGQSMGMTLPPGTTIRIRCGMETGYPEGAVIAFIAAHGLVGHRLIGRGSGRRGQLLLLTRGDGMVICDPPVPADRVLGEVMEWNDGQAWRPMPGPPPVGPARRVGMALSLRLVRILLRISPPLAALAAEKLSNLGRRLTARQSAAPNRK